MFNHLHGQAYSCQITTAWAYSLVWEIETSKFKFLYLSKLIFISGLPLLSFIISILLSGIDLSLSALIQASFAQKRAVKC